MMTPRNGVQLSHPAIRKKEAVIAGMLPSFCQCAAIPLGLNKNRDNQLFCGKSGPDSVSDKNRRCVFPNKTTEKDGCAYGFEGYTGLAIARMNRVGPSASPEYMVHPIDPLCSMR